MIAMLHFATLAAVTVFATAAAFAFDWMLLRAIFVLMRPATVGRATAGSKLARGTAQMAGAFAPHR
jgi:hypothetical protein